MIELPVTEGNGIFIPDVPESDLWQVNIKRISGG